MTARARLVRLVFALPLVGALLRDVRDRGATGWAVFNLIGVAALVTLVWGWAGLNILALVATAVVLLLFFVNA